MARFPTQATKEAVREAAEALLAEGVTPTPTNVQERAGGSLSTVTKHLKVWGAETGNAVAKQPQRVNRDAVFEAADHLKKMGRDVGTRAVARELDSQSYGTIGKHLKAWAEQQGVNLPKAGENQFTKE
jgi:DNA-binding transcriptional ArsR family regulator